MSPTSTPGYPADVRGALCTAAYAELVERGVAGLSLRAIAQRAGVSRATPKWHFGDRSGLLTALATDGYRKLGTALEAAVLDSGNDPSARFTALGRAYLRFGLDEPALFELMFRPTELRPEDPKLREAQDESFSVLQHVTSSIEDWPPKTGAPPGSLTLLAWAAAHGLVALVRDGALQNITRTQTTEATEQLAESLVELFTSLMR